MTEDPHKNSADSPGDAHALIFEGWTRAVQLAWQLAYASRLDELRGERRKAFTDQGLHAFSVEVGRVLAYEELWPDLGLLEFDPWKLRRDAEYEAHQAHEREVVAAGYERLSKLSEELREAAVNGLMRHGFSREDAERMYDEVPPEGEPDERD